MRSGPGTNYSVLQKLHYGEQLILLSINDNWLNIRVKRTGRKGFVYFKYIVVEE